MVCRSRRLLLIISHASPKRMLHVVRMPVRLAQSLLCSQIMIVRKIFKRLHFAPLSRLGLLRSVAYMIYAMANRYLSPDLKECVLRLWDHGWETFTVLRCTRCLHNSCRIFDELAIVNKSSLELSPRLSKAFIEDSDLFLDELQFVHGSPSNTKSRHQHFSIVTQSHTS
jgi:hypothetical protein